MNKETGEIVNQDLIDKMSKAEQEKYTPLSSEEDEVLRPRNRHERRAMLVKMRKDQKEIDRLARSAVQREVKKLRGVNYPVTHNPEVAEILNKEGRGVGLDKK